MRLSVSILLPAILLGYLGYLNIGLAIASGAFLVGITDTPGLLRHKIAGNGLGVLFVFSIFWIIGGIQSDINLLSIFILLLSFILSMLTIYGARGTNLAFSGLIALVLSMGGHSSIDIPLVNAAWHGVGGLWYALLSISLYGFNPYHQTIDALALSIRQIASYFQLRRRLLERQGHSKSTMLEMLNKHVEMSNSHEQIREVLLKNRSAVSGRSNMSRSLVVLFVELVDLTELAMATIYNYNLLAQETGPPKPIHIYINWVRSVEKNLLRIEAKFRLKQTIDSVQDSIELGEAFNKAIQEYSADEEKYLSKELMALLESMYVFTDRVNRRLESIAISANFQTPLTRQEVSRMDLRKFQTRESYSFQRFLDNLSLQSNFFRYAARLSLCLFFAFITTEFLLIQNAYWVLLTIIVIMRPGYGMTKERMYQRVVGTIIGGIFALFVLFLSPPTKVLLVFLSLSIFLSFVYNNRDYRVGVFFTTLFVVFLYGIIEPELFTVVGLRIFDTILGGAFAWIFNFGFLPAHEILTMPNLFQKSINDNKFLFLEIMNFRKDPNFVISYKSFRKNATISNANLNSAFQRLLQEPDTKKVDRSKWQELVSLNHTIYLAVLSLYTLIDERNYLVLSTKSKLLLKAIDLQFTIAQFTFVRNFEDHEVLKKDLEIIKKELYLVGNESLIDSSQEREVADQLLWIYNLSSRIEGICTQIKEM